MPRGKTISSDDLKKQLDQYRAMGPGFASVVKETEEALVDYDTVSKTYNDLRTTIQGNLERLKMAAGVVGKGAK